MNDLSVKTSILVKPIILVTLLMLAAHFSINAQTTPAESNKDEKNRGNSSSQNSIKNPSNRQISGGYVRPTTNERFKRYLNNTVGTGLIGVGIGAGINQIANVPREWKRTGKGFAKRFASSFGENAIQETVGYGLEEALKLDSKFYRSQKRDFGSRLKNALLSGITARTPNGSRVLNPASIIGAFTANLISTQAWYPSRYNYKDGLRQGTQFVSFSLGFGLINEFIIHRKK